LNARVRRRQLRLLSFGFALFLPAALALQRPAWPHDIPNQRVDRSTQATLRPGRIEIDYEVSLTELTLTQDLRSLIGSLPGGERSEWLARYGQVTGPLNAKGFLVSCDGQPVTLSMRDFSLVVEEHPRYTFHLVGALGERGRLLIHDTNYASSEGTSRLAVRARDGLQIDGDTLPEEVEKIPTRQVWELDDEEERRTRQTEVVFRTTGLSSSSSVAGSTFLPSREVAAADESPSTPSLGRHTMPVEPGRTGQLSRLLDRRSRVSLIGLLLFAAGLGAIHSIQPGHGKTLVSAIALQPEARWYQPALLGLVTALAHTGSVLVIAGLLWWTGASQVAALHQGLTQVAGFAIAAGGFWRIGRYLGGWKEHEGEGKIPPVTMQPGSLVSLGLAAGLVPCWDAVGLVVLSAALGRLTVGVLLVIAFGAGMAAVLVGVGLLAARLKSAMLWSGARSWESQLGLLSGLILAGIGMVLFLR
jgi:nickel/cobalt transporter (NicO) family protein